MVSFGQLAVTGALGSYPEARGFAGKPLLRVKARVLVRQEKGI
jgi:hypothetical protein